MGIFSTLADALKQVATQARTQIAGEAVHVPEPMPAAATAAPVPAPVVVTSGASVVPAQPIDEPAVAPSDVKGPICGIDLYQGDLGDRPNFDAVVAAGAPWYWVMLKATQGTSYPYRGWFIDNWPRLKAAAGDRYDRDFFRGAYCYLNFNQDGRAQADYYLATVAKGGGWDHGDMLPMLDVERGGPDGSNYNATRAQVEDVVGAASARLQAQLGRGVQGYGRGLMEDLGITSKMGCATWCNPAYTTTMPSMKSVGVELDAITTWQYAGRETAKVPLAGCTNHLAGFGTFDANVFVDGPRPTTLASFRARCL